MGSLGERIRRKRIESGQSLERIAKDLKIGARQLESIEAEQFDKLPGGVFRKSFVLQYATYLGFDRAAVAAELKHLSAFDEDLGLPGESALHNIKVDPIAPSRDWAWLTGSLGSFTGVVAVVLLCAGLWMLWEKYSQPAVTQQPPPAPVTKAPAPAASVPQQPTQSPTQPPTQLQTVPSATPAPSDATASATPAVAIDAGGPSLPVSVAITTNEETWVQVVSDGKRVFSSSIPANETKRVGGNERVRILIGNAGGLEISLNGKPIGPIGPRGQVRTVELTPAGFQIVPPQAKPSASSPL